MVVVKVVQDSKGYFVVEIVYRESSEDIFEIARHNARFSDLKKAMKLSERVQKTIRANYPHSPVKVLNLQYWEFSSSAYESRMEHKVDVVYI